jgi:hypothetical protein
MDAKQRNQHPEQFLKRYRNYHYSQLAKRSNGKNLGIIMDLIEERFRDLENKIYKKQKKFSADRAQKFLLLHHLGMLQPLIDNSDINLDKKARLLSIILNEDYDNLYDNLSKLGHAKSSLRLEKNYSFLSLLFKDLKLSKLAEKMEILLEKIIKEKNK